MQTNILGPKNARYVNTLTDLDELTKKETAILLACIQDYYEESIHRIALALSEPHGEDELAFLACVLTQFYHKSGITLPKMLLQVANMEVPIVEETTDLIVLFLLQIDMGFRGLETDGISAVVQEASEKRIVGVSNKLKNLSSNDRDHIKLSILADELSNHGSFTLALNIYKLAEDAKSTDQYIDFVKWEKAKILAEAYNVGALIIAVNRDLPENERDLINQLHKVIPVHHLVIKERLRKQKEEREMEAEEKRLQEKEE